MNIIKASWLVSTCLLCIILSPQEVASWEPDSEMVQTCRDIFTRSAVCQITYLGWRLLTRCIKGEEVPMRILESQVTCPNPSCRVRPDSTPRIKLPPEPIRDRSPDIPTIALPVAEPAPPRTGSKSDASPQASSRDYSDYHDEANLDDDTYTAPDGSQAMASRGVQGDGNTYIGIIVAVLVVVVVLVVVFCMLRGRRRALEAAEMEDEAEAKEGEGGEMKADGEEGAQRETEHDQDASAQGEPSSAHGEVPGEQNEVHDEEAAKS